MRTDIFHSCVAVSSDSILVRQSAHRYGLQQVLSQKKERKKNNINKHNIQRRIFLTAGSVIHGFSITIVHTVPVS